LFNKYAGRLTKKKRGSNTQTLSHGTQTRGEKATHGDGTKKTILRQFGERLIPEEKDKGENDSQPESCRRKGGE